MHWIGWFTRLQSLSCNTQRLQEGVELPILGAGPLRFRANNRSVRKPPGSGGDRWHFQTCYIAKLPFHIQFRGHSFSRQFCRGSQAFSRAPAVRPRAVFTCTGWNPDWLSKLPLLFLPILMCQSFIKFNNHISSLDKKMGSFVNMARKVNGNSPQP